VCSFKFWLININGDVTAAIFIEEKVALSTPQFLFDFLENWYIGISGDLLDLGLHFSNIRHHLLVKMTVEKAVETGIEVN